MTIEDIVKEIIRQQKEYTERTLSELIAKYDFIVGSKEIIYKLMEILPDGVNVVYSPYVDPTMVYVIKKFDIRDLLTEPYRGESEGKEIKNEN